MNSGRVVLLPIVIVLAVVIVAGVLVLFLPKEEQKTGEKFGVFDYTCVDEIKRDEYKVEEGGSYLIQGVTLLDAQGDMKYKLDDTGAVVSVRFESELQGKLTEKDGEPYVENPIDKTDLSGIEKRVTKLNSDFADSIGCPAAASPLCICFTTEEEYAKRPDNIYEAMINGYTLFEYSYRDASGTLWFLKVYSPFHGVLKATVTKLVDESGFNGYEPLVNMYSAPYEEQGKD